jgi:hypothetical protein
MSIGVDGTCESCTAANHPVLDYRTSSSRTQGPTFGDVIDNTYTDIPDLANAYLEKGCVKPSRASDNSDYIPENAGPVLFPTDSLDFQRISAPDNSLKNRSEAPGERPGKIPTCANYSVKTSDTTVR